MGVAQSRQLEKQLNEACAKADSVGSTQISKFLGDTFVRSAVAALNDLERNGDDDASLERISDALKSFARKKTISKQKSPRALKYLFSSDTQIILQDDIKRYLVPLKSGISPFFEDHEVLQIDPLKSVPGLVYRLLSHLKQRLVIDQIRRRILFTVLFKSLALFSRERINGTALPILASVILGSGLAGTDLGAIRHNLTEWTKKGKRYSNLGDHLGGSGTIILLPYDIGDTVWEHELQMKGKIHNKVIEKLRQRGIWTEAIRKWDIPMQQRDGKIMLVQSSVHDIAQDMFKKMLDSIKAEMQDCINKAATNHYSPSMMHQDGRPSLYTKPLTDLALPVPRPDVSQHCDLSMGVRTEPADSPSVEAIATISPIQQSQCAQHEHSQQSGASHLPPPQDTMNLDLSDPFACKFGSGGPDGSGTITASRMAADGAASQTFSHLEGTSSQNIVLRAAQEPTLRQSMYCEGQLGEGLISESGHLVPQSSMGLSAVTAGYFPTFTEPEVGYSGDFGPYSDIGLSAVTPGYLPTYPESGLSFPGEDSDPYTHDVSTSGAINYLPMYPDCEVAFVNGVSGLRFNSVTMPGNNQ